MFRIIGVIVFTPLSLFWQLLNQFLLSPWGLIAPMTLLIAFFAFQQLQNTPAQIAQFYAKQLDTCTEAELPQLLGALVRLGDAGVPGLVRGLTSPKEAVFTASRSVLHQEFDHWKESDQREHHFRILAEAILHACGQFSPAAQAEAMRFVDAMMKIRPIETTSPESTADRQAVIAHCEKIFQQLESMRRRRLEPQGDGFAPQTDTIASINQRTEQPVLVASNGLPFIPTSARQNRGDEVLLADAGSYNPFSVARADRLQAYQKSVGVDSAAPSLLPPFSPPSIPAGIEERIAQNFSANEPIVLPTALLQVADISEEYRNRIQSASGTSGVDNFITLELQNTPLDSVSSLKASQLMQLLHHPDPAHVDSAWQTLVSRDGFQEMHFKLAWRLYHPNPAVRQEIVAMLAQTPNVQPSVWLKVLLDDPSNDVRYRTASFLATAHDPALQRLLIDRGKRDGDPRITSLANRLDELHRETHRR